MRALRRRSPRRPRHPRRDREGLRRAAEDAPPRRQRGRRGRRLRRDGRHPARDLAGGGPQAAATRRSWRSIPAFAVAPRVRLAQGRLRPGQARRAPDLQPRRPAPAGRARGPGRQLGARARPRARRSRTSGRWRCWCPTPRRATASCSTSRSSSRRSSTLHVASFSAVTCVYKVMGAPQVLQRYFDDLTDERARDRRAARAQPLLDEHVAVVHARPAVLGAGAQRRDQHRSRGCARRRACSACRSATTPPTRRTSTA